MKVLLIVIDAASPRVVCPAVQTGRLANLKRLSDAGQMHEASVTIFPSITPAATASIITGGYPFEHGIAGAAWFDESRQEIAYYGDDFWVIAREGFGAFLRDFLVRLNGDRLQRPTLFEIVERHGRTAACLNYLVYRGLQQHRVNVPWLLAMMPGVPLTESVTGPGVLRLGDFVTGEGDHQRLRHRGGPLHRFGMDDASTARMLEDLAGQRQMPDFTVAYFADNDFESHEVGPHSALPIIDRVDAALGRMFDAAGGFDHFIQDTCVIVTSDHGHCEILPDAGHSVIYLHELLADFKQMTLGKGWQNGDEVAICPNMRAAQLYLRGRSPGMVERIRQQALLDPRIDLVMWKIPVGSDAATAFEASGPAGRLTFWRADDQPGTGDASASDDHGTAWAWRGNLELLGVERDGARLVWTTYPNAFERIAGVLDASNSGDIWMTARPGCEFEARGGKAHVGGGSHGALHALDSLSPVIVAGARRPLPAAMRSIDIAGVCLEALGIRRDNGGGGGNGITRRRGATEQTKSRD